MKLNKFAVVFLAVLAISFSIPAFTVRTAQSEFLPEPYDIGPKLRDTNFKPEAIYPDETATEITETSSDEINILDTKIWCYYDDYWGGVGLAYFHLVAESETTEIWLQDNTAYPIGDTRECIITQSQLDYLLEEYDSNIYPIDTEYFGVPDFYDGSTQNLDYLWDEEYLLGLGITEDYYYSPEGKNVIQVSNIRDDNYYDSTYSIFIIGFYWGLYEYMFQRNIINIDADHWEDYVGDPINAYEATIAHEEQHLIHADYNPEDATFMNEGCSTFAEFLCGYGVPWGDINWYLATPDNSLTVWGDQGGKNILADYGVAFLWAMYLNDRFGPEFLGNFVQSGIPGIDGLDAAMAPRNFHEVYHDWRVAILLDSQGFGYGKYGYKTIDLSTADQELRVYDIEIPVFMSGTDFGTTYQPWYSQGTGWDTGIKKIAPYGSDYISINNLDDCRGNKLFLFDGDDGVYLTWELNEYGEWYSGGQNLYNALLAGEAYVDPEDPTLVFGTWYFIEQYWDFGFVQVSTDNGETWTSLENENTTYLHYSTTLPEIIDYLPGLTGYSGGVIPDMTFDLSDYAGLNVLIGFRYMTDTYTTWDNWYVWDAMVSGELLDLAPIADLIPIDWMVTLVYYKETRWWGMLPFKMKDVRLYSPLDIGLRFIGRSADKLVIIVTPINTPLGFADYEFALFGFHKCWY